MEPCCLELVGERFGKLLALRLSFLPVWCKIWLARTDLVLPFDLLDGEKP